MNPLFQAVVEATEEAIVNALVSAESMTGEMALLRIASRTIGCERCSRHEPWVRSPRLGRGCAPELAHELHPAGVIHTSSRRL